MRDLIATITEATFTLRATTRAQWLLRTLTFLAGAVAGGLCLQWFPHVYGAVFLGLVLLGCLVSVVGPDSWAPTVTLAGVAFWWFVGAGGTDWWQWVVLAALMAAFHLGAALGASAPPWARAERTVARRWARTAMVYLLLVVLALGVVVAFVTLPGVPRGMVWVVVASVALIVAALALLEGLTRRQQRPY